MNRRELLKMIGLATGTAIIGSDLILSACNTEKRETRNGFTQDDVALLDEVAETIIPRTSTPGAKDAAVGMFMTVMVNDCYTEQDQKVFFEGMKTLNELSWNQYNDNFVDLKKEQREELLTKIETEARAFQKKVDDFNDAQNKKEREAFDSGNLSFVKERKSSHYYIMMKQLTLFGYFTSEVGATQAFRHVAVPGRYDGCIPYNKGDRAWA
jgi:hypothetical protein